MNLIKYAFKKTGHKIVIKIQSKIMLKKKNVNIARLISPKFLLR